MSILNDVLRSFARTIGRILAYIALGAVVAFLFGKVANAQTQLGFTSWGCGNSSNAQGFDTSYTYRTCNTGSVWLNIDYPQISGSFTAHAKVEFIFNDSSNEVGYKTIKGAYYINNQSSTTNMSIACPVNGNTAVCDVYVTGILPTPQNIIIQLQLTGSYYTSNSFQARASGSITYDTSDAGLTNGGFISGINGVINSQNQNTEDIKTNDNNNTNAIINNNNSNTQSIINSNKETQDTIKDQFNDCRDSYNLVNYNAFILNQVPSISDGNLVAFKGAATSDYISVDNSKYYWLSLINNSANQSYVFYYDSNKNYLANSSVGLNGYREYNLNKNSSFSNAAYIRIRVDSYNAVSEVMLVQNELPIKYEAYGEKICENRLDKTNEELEEANETSKNILQTIIDLPGKLLDMLLGLFIPDNFDFLNGFLETLENKLGFIASVPIQFLDFLINLVNVDFDDITSITMPSFEILGYEFFQQQEIDLSGILDIFKPYRIYTNIGCVCLCIGYLLKLYENFANGGNQ